MYQEYGLAWATRNGGGDWYNRTAINLHPDPYDCDPPFFKLKNDTPFPNFEECKYFVITKPA